MHQHGAQSAPQLVYKFPGVNCISLNDEAVHGIPSERRVEEGDLVKLDVTVEKDGFMADAAITVAAGEVPEESERLIACAEQAFAKAMLVARAGFRVSEIGRAVEREVRRSGFSVIRDLGGHGIGRTIHEAPRVPNFADPAANQILTEGLVITVEPIIAAGSGRAAVDKDGWTVRTLDRRPSAHLRAHAGDHKGRADSTDCVSSALPNPVLLPRLRTVRPKAVYFFADLRRVLSRVWVRVDTHDYFFDQSVFRCQRTGRVRGGGVSRHEKSLTPATAKVLGAAVTASARFGHPLLTAKLLKSI